MKQRPKLNYFLIFSVFLILFATNACICTCLVVLYLTGVIEKLHMAPLLVAILSMVASLLISTTVSGLLVKYYFRPLNDLIAATKRIRAGDLSVQLREYGQGAYRRFPGQNELAQTVHSFNEMVRELNSVEIFRKDFISNFSHEFKTPILSIRGFARQLCVGNITEEQRVEFSHIIWEEADYLSHMSSNVLLLTKLENQQIVADRKAFRLDEQLRDALLLQERRWSEKNLQVDCELEEVTFTHNPEILSHIWTNLISNAIKFTPDGGSIHVRCQEDSRSVTVCVEDTGIGMDAETQKHIYEKFYQGDASRQTAGNGLGLSLVRRIVDLSGGTLSLVSEVGKGSTFTVCFPKSSDKICQ